MYTLIRYKKLIIILLIGSLMGAVAALSANAPEGSIVYVLGGFLNTASVWSLFAFWVGFKFKNRHGALFASIGGLAASIIVYYLTTAIFIEFSLQLVTLAAIVISWIFVASIIGSINSLAGRMAAFSSKTKLKVFATIIPLTIVLTENVYNILQLIPHLQKNYAAFIPFFFSITLIVISIALPFLIIKNSKLSLYIVMIAVFLAIMGVFILNLMYSFV